MTAILQDVSREALIVAIEQNYIDFTCTYVRTARKQVHEDAQVYPCINDWASAHIARWMPMDGDHKCDSYNIA